ncbi:MAG: SpoIIE family protein phosphatase [Candidatus Riflebacteria bacterium]|nr:SpoIIE family protein phosphatase [Candidatus Riflebacteria bacterium]
MTKNSQLPADGYKILMVDDDSAYCEIIGQVLKQNNYNFFYAENGNDASKLALENIPDLLIIDMNLRLENGLSVFLRLKEISELKNTPAIFLSCDSSEKTIIEALELGGSDYIVKPCNINEFLLRVKNQISNKVLMCSAEKQSEKLSQLTTAQKLLLPSEADLADLSASVFYKPLNEAGGDYYDAYKVAKDVVDYYVADTCGHNVGSSLIGATLKALIRQNANYNVPLKQTFQKINTVMKSIIPDEVFISVVYLRINRAIMKAEVLCAGHPSPIFLSQPDGAFNCELAGDPLGSFNEVSFETKEIDIAPSEKIFLFSDGILEAIASNSKTPIATLTEMIRNHKIENCVSNSTIISSISLPNEVTDDIVFLEITV